MAKQKRKKRKIVITQRATLVHLNDKTRVARKDTMQLRQAPTRLAGDNAANFKIKLRRK